MLYGIVMVAVLFGGTVFVHELGHFLTAKWFNLRIDAFSIGMGPALWQKKVNGVVYKIGALPIGGYVALPQMDITGSAFENEDAREGRLQPVAPWKRMVIAVAGPVMNVLAALVLCGVVWMMGKPFDASSEPAFVGSVQRNSAAYEAGLRPGDQIVQVNGDRIRFWADVEIAGSLNHYVQLRVQRGNELADLPMIQTSRNSLGFLHMAGVRPREFIEHVFVEGLSPNSPATRAGIELGDVLHRINGQPIESASGFAQAVQAAGSEPIRLEVLRGADAEPVMIELEAEFSPRIQRYLIGIVMQEKPSDVMVRPNPVTQMQFFSGSIFRTLRAFSRSQERAQAAQGIGGPVIMLGSIHQQVRASLSQALWFTALINVNLAIINLLPLVVLDGGHILLALFEMVFRTTLPRRLVIAMANVVVVLLLTLMVSLTVKDIRLMHRIHQLLNDDPVPAAVPEPAEEAPAP